jgi:ubiquinone/menaquinone biosynthesis C-methylase UbiE
LEIANVYEDTERAASYAKLEFPGTYYLAYRDLPAIISEHVKGRKAVDFGCGTGRSTRFLRRMGLEPMGIDIAANMVKQARELDGAGDYRLIEDGDLSACEAHAYDLVLSVFTFDNIPTMGRKVKLLTELRKLLNQEGRIVNLVSSPEIYTHEWASFTTKDFPENAAARSGDKVKIIMTDVEDRRPVEDILWSDEDYREAFRRAGLEVVTTHKPLAKPDEAYAWVSEACVAPWVIYVLRAAEPSA